MKKERSESAAEACGSDAIARIGAHDRRHVAHLYELYRREFVAFARRCYSLDEAAAAEVYQASFIALYENIREGRLARLSVSLKTYLFRIARNKILNARRDAAGKNEELREAFPDFETDGWAARQEIVYRTVQEMREPCSTVLTLYYWERRSMEQIARTMNYAGAQVAKNRKLACMRKLKAVLTAKLTAEGLI